MSLAHNTSIQIITSVGTMYCKTAVIIKEHQISEEMLNFRLKAAVCKILHAL